MSPRKFLLNLIGLWVIKIPVMAVPVMTVPLVVLTVTWWPQRENRPLVLTSFQRLRTIRRWFSFILFLTVTSLMKRRCPTGNDRLLVVLLTRRRRVACGCRVGPIWRCRGESQLFRVMRTLVRPIPVLMGLWFRRLTRRPVRRQSWTNR